MREKNLTSAKGGAREKKSCKNPSLEYSAVYVMKRIGIALHLEELLVEKHDLFQLVAE